MFPIGPIPAQRRAWRAAAVVCLPATAMAQAPLPGSGTLTLPTYVLTIAAVVAGVLLVGLLLWRRSLLAAFRRAREDLESRLADRERSEQALQRIREELERELSATTRERNEAQRELADTRAALEQQVSRFGDVARIDELTGLANRARFDEALDDEIKRMVRERNALSMLLCEIDLNEEFARDNGADRTDATHKKVAAAVESTFRRAGDLVARLDDGRIAVILPATDVTAAQRFGERLRSNVWDLCIPFDQSDIADRLTVSVGVATAEPDRLHKPDQLLAASDRSLYTATENGRNRVGPGSRVAG